MPFTLTMLGTDTLFTPEGQKFPVVDYPRGETLSIVSTLITGDAVRNDKAISSYVSNQVEVIIGPTTTGTEVADRIIRGVLAVLKAIARGETTINIMAHSRGAVEAILVAHEINNIQKYYCDAQKEGRRAPNLFAILTILAKDESSNPKGNTGKIQQHLVKMAEIKEISGAFNDTIGNVHINLFATDPVPGDAPLYGWEDSRYCQIPEIVTDCEVYLYENERTRFFTPLQLVPSSNSDARFFQIPMPGHHGSGSSGNNRDQATIPVPETKGNASHIQQLMFFKIMAFLGKHGVEFRKPEEWVFDETSLLKVIVDELDKPDKPDKQNSQDMPWSEELVLPICFKLYCDILQNIEAYQYFNSTNYQNLGQAAAYRYILTKDKVYRKFSDVLPQSHGYVNAEHANIAEKILFKVLGLSDISELLPLHAVVSRAAEALFNGIQAYYLVKKDTPGFRNNPVAQLLVNAEGKKQVIDSFSVLVDRISQTYMRNNLAADEKRALLESVQKTFITFREMADKLGKDPGVNQEKPLQEFINTILLRVKEGIANTLKLQYQGLQDDVLQLRKNSDTYFVAFQFDEHIKDTLRSLVYGSFLPLIIDDNAIQYFNDTLDNIFDFAIGQTGDKKILFIWNKLTGFLLEKEGFWSDDTKEKIRQFDLQPQLFSMTSLPREAEITLNNFKLLCVRLNDFRSGLEIFRPFDPDITFSEMEQHLEEMEWALIHKAAEFAAGKNKPAPKMDWDKFDQYINGLLVLQGEDAPVALKNQHMIAELNKEILQIRDEHTREQQRHLQEMAEKDRQLAEMQEKIRQGERLAKEQKDSLDFYTVGSDRKSLTFWQSHDEIVVNELDEQKEMIATVS